MLFWNEAGEVAVSIASGALGRRLRSSPSQEHCLRRKIWLRRRARRSRAMRVCSAHLTLSFVLLAAGASSAHGEDRPPAWAYPVNPPNFQRAPDDGTIRQVPDSTIGFTLTQLRD